MGEMSFVKRPAPTRDEFKESLKRSALFHLAALVVIFVIFPWIHTPYHQAPTRIVMVELPRGSGDDITGLRKVDRLPETTVQESQTLPTQQSQEAVKQEPPKVVQEAPKVDPSKMKDPALTEKTKKEPGKNTQKPAKKAPLVTSDMQRALDKINKALEGRSVVPEAAQTKDSGEGYIYGTSDKPQRVSPDDAEYLRYQAQVRAKILREWIVPAHLLGLPQESKPRAAVVVLIDKDGFIRSTHLEKRSSIQLLDSSALRAIERAAPLPIPPERLKWEAYNEGFLVDFIPN